MEDFTADQYFLLQMMEGKQQVLVVLGTQTRLQKGKTPILTMEVKTKEEMKPFLTGDLRK